MKIIANTLLVSSLCILMSVPAHAGRYHNDGRLMDRMDRQHQRIERGVESGALDRKEARTLKKQQRKIRSMVRIFREDDVLSKKERRILNRKLDMRSVLIREYKHNDRARHTDRHVFRDTFRDASRHHRRSGHHEYDGHYKDDDGIVYRHSERDALPQYGYLFW